MSRYSLRALFLLTTLIAVFFGGWMTRDRMVRNQEREIKSMREWIDRHKSFIDLTERMGQSSWSHFQLSVGKSLTPEIELFEKEFPIYTIKFIDHLKDDPKSDFVNRDWQFRSKLDDCHDITFTLDCVFTDTGPFLNPISISSMKYELVLIHVQNLRPGETHHQILKSFSVEEWKQFRKNTPDILTSSLIQDCKESP